MGVNGRVQEPQPPYEGAKIGQMEQLVSRSSVAVSVLAPESFVIGDCEAREWDAFLARTPGGSYAQTSLWSSVKQKGGYRARRFTVSLRGTIVGGAQVLIRRLPVWGAVGYVPLGPVSALLGNTEVARLLASHLCKVAREEKIVYLAVQPPRDHEVFSGVLDDSGFVRTTLNIAPNATVQIDLSNSLERLLSNMHKTTKFNVKASQRKGVTVREGAREDLGTFCSLLSATAQRQDFVHPGQNHFEHVWEVFSAGGHIRLFIAEYEGEAVSAALLMAFGDTVTYWKTGWSGEHIGRRYPNEAIQWAAIQWAKSQGYRYYDFGGIHRRLGIDLLAGKSDHNPKEHGTSLYKVGYGGEVKLLPEASAYVYNRLFRGIASKVSDMQMVSRTLSRLR